LLGLIILILSLALAWLIRSIERPIHRLIDWVGRLRESHDLTARFEASGRDEISHIGRAVTAMVADFHGLFGHIATQAEEVAGTAQELGSIAVRTDADAEQQRQRAETLLERIRRVSGSLQEMTRSMGESADAADQARRVTREGNRIVQDTIGSIERLTDDTEHAARSIQQLREDAETVSKVVDVITAIAEQTNLLALNAAIEAARAGEQGRGFAVVADEVRTLASRTRESTEETHQMIERLQQGSEQAVTVMEQSRRRAGEASTRIVEAGEALSTIARSVERIGELAQQTADSIREESRNAESVSHNAEEIQRIAESTATGTRQVMESGNRLAGVSRQLREGIARFRL